MRGGIDVRVARVGVAGVGEGGFCARGEGEEVGFLDDGLDEADGEGGVAAVDVCDVRWVGLVDFVDDEAEGFADGGIVGASGGVVAGASDADGGLREGGEDVAACAGEEEAHPLEAVEREEVLVAVGVEDEGLEVLEVLGAEAAGDAGFETQEAEDSG